MKRGEQGAGLAVRCWGSRLAGLAVFEVLTCACANVQRREGWKRLPNTKWWPSERHYQYYAFAPQDWSWLVQAGPGHGPGLLATETMRFPGVLILWSLLEQSGAPGPHGP